MARLGDLDIFVTEENPSFGNYMTDQPIEDGTEITDHVRNEPNTLQVRGKVTGEDAGERFNQLREMRRERQPHLYVGRNYINRMVIEGLDTEHDNNIANGFRFTLRLKQVTISKPSPVKELPVPERSQAKEVENKGREQIEEREEDPEEDERIAVGTAVPRGPSWYENNPDAEPEGNPMEARKVYEADDDIAVGTAVPR